MEFPTAVAAAPASAAASQTSQGPSDAEILLGLDHVPPGLQDIYKAARDRTFDDLYTMLGRSPDFIPLAIIATETAPIGDAPKEIAAAAGRLTGLLRAGVEDRNQPGTAYRQWLADKTWATLDRLEDRNREMFLSLIRPVLRVWGNPNEGAMLYSERPQSTRRARLQNRAQDLLAPGGAAANTGERAAALHLS